MLGRLKQLPLRRVAFAHHEAGLPLLPVSGGREHLLPGERYDWDNRQRLQDAVVLQLGLAGCGRLVDDAGVHRIEAGQALLVQLPSATAYGRWGQEAWDFVSLNCRGSWVTAMSRRLIERHGGRLDLRPHPAVLAALLRCLRFGLAGDHSAMQASAHGYAVFMALLDAFPVGAAADLPDAVRDALRRIDATFADPQLNVDRLASESGLSRAHFARCFRRHVGATPHAVLSRRRLDHAEQLLRSTGLDLATVATRCGFSSASYLCHAFRRERGCSPGSLRP